MSLETGKKLGFISSLISIISPILIGVVSAVFLMQFVAFLGSIISSSSSFGSTSDLTSIIASFQGLMVGLGVLGSLSLVGFVLFYVSMYLLSKYYNAPRIFHNLLKALLISIVTGVALGIVIGLVFIGMVGAAITSPTAGVFSIVLPVVIIALVVFYVIMIYCSILQKRAFDILADKSGVGNFKTAGLLFLIGTFGMIVPLLGIISWIGWIFAALGYNKLKAIPPQTETYSPSPSTQTTKSCSHCGAENVVDASYCCVCGGQIP